MRTSRALVLLVLAFSFFLVAQDTSNTVRLADRSDWWSVLNENFYWPIDKPSNGELNADSFEIAGFRLAHDSAFRAVRSRFGNAVSVARGQTSNGRYQICYTSRDKDARLIFEQGELNLGFYLLGAGQGWNGQALCAESPQVSASLRTRNGLGLGISPADVLKILGTPDLSSETRLVYQREIEQRTPDDKLAELRKDHSEMSEKDFHDNYDSYELELYIEARFANGKLTYLAATKAESY